MAEAWRGLWVALGGRDRQSEAHGMLRGGLSMLFEDREASDWRERIALGTDLDASISSRVLP